MKERVGFASDRSVCLIILWPAQEEKYEDKDGVMGLF